MGKKLNRPLLFWKATASALSTTVCSSVMDDAGGPVQSRQKPQKSIFWNWVKLVSLHLRRAATPGLQMMHQTYLGLAGLP